jgi:hypothetical protein
LPVLRRALLASLLCLLLPAAAFCGIGGSLGFPAVTTVYGGGTYPRNGYSAICVACHTRNPATRDSVPGTDYHGTHFVYGGGAIATGHLTWQKVDAWVGTGALSKYGGPANLSQTGTAGELICESCHNLKANTGAYKLVVTDNDATDPSPLCEGCHARTGPGHHLLTNDLSSLHAGTMNNADSPFVRNPPLTLSEATYPGSNGLNCRSCHVPHNGWTQAGARVLKRGYRSTDGSGLLGQAVTGIERSSENPASPGAPVVKDYEPLCNGCHKVSY